MMDKQYNNINAALSAARNEGKVTGASILQEIEPLIKDYFVCGVKQSEEGLSLSLLNGQSFTISIKEI